MGGIQLIRRTQDGKSRYYRAVTSSLDEADCLNCGMPLHGPYCVTCGQKAAPVNPTFKDLVRDVADELLNVDGKIFRSTRLLLTRPGFPNAGVLRGPQGELRIRCLLYTSDAADEL